MKKISCIIPAYNEGKRIASVLDIVIGHPLISEVIVVDDGSSDDTRDVVARYSSIKLIALEKNGGKSAAIVEGVRQAENELILFLDADLSGLSANALSSLIEPVQSGKADVSISLRHNSPLQWRLMGLDYISGERVFSKNFLMPLLPACYLSTDSASRCISIERSSNSVCALQSCGGAACTVPLNIPLRKSGGILVSKKITYVCFFS